MVWTFISLMLSSFSSAYCPFICILQGSVCSSLLPIFMEVSFLLSDKSSLYISLLSAVWLGVLIHSGFSFLGSPEAVTQGSCCFTHYSFIGLYKCGELGRAEDGGQAARENFYHCSSLLSSKKYFFLSKRLSLMGSQKTQKTLVCVLFTRTRLLVYIHSCKGG